MKNETKEKNFALRLIVRHFINNLSEDYKVYVYFSNGRLIYIDGEIKNIFIANRCCNANYIKNNSNSQKNKNNNYTYNYSNF